MNEDLLEFADFVGRLLAEEWYEMHQQDRSGEGDSPRAANALARDADRGCRAPVVPGPEGADDGGS